MRKEEREKRTPLDTNLTLQDIIDNSGYYDINHNWNSIITFPNKPNSIFRFRVEVLILNKKNEIYMVVHNDGTYRLPGGGVEKGRSYKYQVEQESKEEAGIKLGKIYNCEVSYFRYFKNKYANCDICWDGTYNKIFIAKFKDWDYDIIREDLKDNDIRYNGRFVSYERAVNILNKYHLTALQKYNDLNK